MEEREFLCYLVEGGKGLLINWELLFTDIQVICLVSEIVIKKQKPFSKYISCFRISLILVRSL